MVRTEAVGVLAAGLAHDLNSMLGGIIATAELVAGRARPGGIDVRDLEAIILQAGRASELVRQILAFSRQETLKPERFQLAEMVRTMAPVLTAVAGRHVSVAIETEVPAPTVADRTAIERVVMNLLINARDAIHAGGEMGKDTGRLLIRTGMLTGAQLPAAGANFMERRDYATLSIADNGPGVPPSIAARIFEPYFSTKQTGQGLGLASAFGLVKQSGGYLLLDEGPLGGACFTCYLPLAAPCVAPVNQAPGRATVRHILLVEDEPLLCASLARGLEVAGYRVTPAEDGVTALTSFQTQDDIDFLLTDIRIPGIDGIELARRLRVLAPRLPVLLMSGYADEQARAAILGMDAGFVAKPVTFKTLCERINALVAQD